MFFGVVLSKIQYSQNTLVAAKCEMSPSFPYRSFVFLCLVSLVLWWHTLVTTYALALRNNAYTHILLILPISVALIFLEWGSRKAQPEPNFRAGRALLVLAVLRYRGYMEESKWPASRHTTFPGHVGCRHMVDWVVHLLFRHPYLPDVRFPAVLPAVVGPSSWVCFGPHRKLLATGLSVRRQCFSKSVAYR